MHGRDSYGCTCIKDVAAVVRGMRRLGMIHVVDHDADEVDVVMGVLRVSGLPARAWSLMSILDSPTKELQPGCLLVDLCDPRLGEHALQRLEDMSSHLAVIVLTRFGSTAAAVRAMQAGAVDFLEKPVGEASLLEAVGRALGCAAERSIFQPDEAARRAVASLTRRERDVLDGLIRGATSKRIARDLAISPRTVEIHRGRLMAKLRVNSLARTMRIAFDAGLR